VEILEEYQKHHWLLTERTGAETLFLGRDGKPISNRTLRETIENLTLKRGHWRITPAAFRGIFAHYWLQQHPADYENLAQVLWTSIPWTKEMYDENWTGDEYWRRKKSA
jgi:site-specific recombinase XerD